MKRTFEQKKNDNASTLRNIRTKRPPRRPLTATEPETREATGQQKRSKVSTKKGNEGFNTSLTVHHESRVVGRVACPSPSPL